MFVVWCKLITIEKSPLLVDVNKISSQVLSRLLANKPYAPLSVPATVEGPHVGNAKPTDFLDDAIASFQSTFSECTAAAQNKLGIKFASLKQHQSTLSPKEDWQYAAETLQST